MSNKNANTNQKTELSKIKSFSKRKSNVYSKGGAFGKDSQNISNEAFLKNRKAGLLSFMQKRKIKVGNNYAVKLTSLLTNNVGLNDVSFGFPIVIGNIQKAKASLGDVVVVKMLKTEIQNSTTASNSKDKVQKNKYVIAKAVRVVKKSTQPVTSLDFLGRTFDVTITNKGPKGTYVAEIPASNNGQGAFKVYINPSMVFKTSKPLNLVGQKLTVKVTRVKANFGFGSLKQAVQNPALGPISKLIATANVKATQQQSKMACPALKEGTKFTLTLPKNATRYLKHMVIPLKNATQKGKNSPVFASLQNTILFIKPCSSLAGAKLGDKVQIQILKAWQNTTGLNQKTVNIAIGKVYQINPASLKQKHALVKADIQKMVFSGMHYGEQTIKCNARMQSKNYVLPTRTDTNSQQPGLTKALIQKSRSIINLLKTRRCLNKALAQLTKYAAKGKTFLFVGTKKAAAGLIARSAFFSKNAVFVNNRWLGGILTNWKTVSKSIAKIRPILKEKQAIIQDILEKRHSIKNVLLEKAFLIKKKSRLFIKKGKQLVQKLKSNDSSLAQVFGQDGPGGQNVTLATKQMEVFQQGQLILEKRQALIQKRKTVIVQSQTLFKTAFAITQSTKVLLNKANLLRKKLRELKYLLFVSQQVQKIQSLQRSATDNKANGIGTNFYTISFNQYKQIENQNGLTSAGYVIPNPPKEILNKMVLVINKQEKNVETSNISKKEANKSSGSDSDSQASQTLVMTKFLSQFSSFAPSIKQSIQKLLTNLKEIQNKLSTFQQALNTIANKIQSFVTLKTQIVNQLRSLHQYLVVHRNIIRVVKRKIKQINAQKRLFLFLPKLRFLPTPSAKITQTVQVLMKKVVDPKLKYPMDSIYDQKLSNQAQTKKVAAMRKKKWQRLEKYFGGISNMTKMNPNQIRNNIAVIVGQQEEMNAVRECQKLGIKMFHIVDTNCNPALADHFIPANDDSRNSIKYILTLFLTRIVLAQRIQQRLSLA
jgi:ribosomal protein S2